VLREPKIVTADIRPIIPKLENLFQSTDSKVGSTVELSPAVAI
jgi:hypothetical protein